MKMKSGRSLNFLLLGKTGAGLSSTGNSLLNKKVFKSASNNKPETKKMRRRYRRFRELSVMVVDGPGLAGHQLEKVEGSEAVLKHQDIARGKCSERSDVFLFVTKFGHRFTREEENVLECLENIYGETFYKQVIIVMTGGEDFQGAMEEEECNISFQEWCRQQTGRFQKLYQDCNGRCALLDNRQKNKNRMKQIQEIIGFAHAMQARHGLPFSLRECEQIISSYEIKISYTHKQFGSKNYIFWILCLLLSHCYSKSTPYPRHVCHPGTYLVTAKNDLDFCLPCTVGVNFMPDSWHTHRNCYNCTQIRDQDLEILVTECTRTHDAEILCTPGYYRRRARNVREQDRCEKCFECEQPTLACQGYQDTVCCGNPNYDAVKDMYGLYICVEHPVFCGPGHFLHPQTRQCKPCPAGTFMTEDKHNNTACRVCQNPSDNEVIVQSCNSTNPSVIGCMEGYFRDSKEELLTGEINCLPCQKYEHQGRECDTYHNTVCCCHPGMTIMDTDSGPMCRPPDQTNVTEQTTRNITGETTVIPDWSVCGVGQYLYSSPGNNSVTCLPCNEGTYMEEINHNFTVCKNCTDIKDGNLPSVCLPGTENQPDADTNDRLTLWLSVANLILVVCMEITILVICCKQKFQGKTRSVKLRRELLVNLAMVYVHSIFLSVKTALLPRNTIAVWLDLTATVCILVSTLFILKCYSISVYKTPAKKAVKRLNCHNKRYINAEVHTEQHERSDVEIVELPFSECHTETLMICSV